MRKVKHFLPLAALALLLSSCGEAYNPANPPSKSYSSVHIRSYTVYRLNYVDASGRYWDDSYYDGPDIYMRIYSSSGEELHRSSNIWYNATDEDMPFTLSLGYTLRNLNSTYLFVLCDYDDFFVDEMCYFTFCPSDCAPEYPTSLDLNGDGYSMTINMEWQ